MLSVSASLINMLAIIDNFLGSEHPMHSVDTFYSNLRAIQESLRSQF